MHGRYDADAFVSAIDESISDVYVAEHSYMAEPFIRSAKYGSPFVINTVNTESQVWKVTRGFAGRIEAPRILRDEIRVARAADAVGTYDAEEAEMYHANGVRDARWIDLTLEPAPRLDSSETEKRLVFMGTRGWPPNQEAFKIALQYWPAISAGIESAELCIIGAKADGATDPDYPEGVRDLGFVDDLQELLGTCRALIAPVATGGGVRVKILDAASKGLPVVGSSAAVGSLGSIFELPTFDDPEQFVAECRRYLLDRNTAVKAGERLHDLNAERWDERAPVTFLQQMYAAGAAGLMDAVALHPYTFPFTVENDPNGQWAQVDQAYGTMAANGDGSKKIWITELGAPTGNGPMAVSEDAQAAIIGSSVAQASKLPYVGPVFVHSLRDSGTDASDSEQNYGLLRADFSRKPSFAVVQGS